ncbi:hypothetical protein [Prevotella sp. E13-27]|uniref:hypothetical protein n=1 Tax=Prevotella sp. E13-27 TaxID=2938122 RepID=UPI00200B6BDB|nr:hypothetical protein [Prevotella sp. E13-27]MCK8621042.1 hypothetical protein [Prevotella sp. E13-27]
MRNRLTVFAITLLFSTTLIFAKSYRIHRLWGKGKIMISKKEAVRGMIINEKSKIICTTDEIGMSVINDLTGTYFDFYGKIAYPMELTINDYMELKCKYEKKKLLQKVPLWTKGSEDEKQYLYLLNDSLPIIIENVEDNASYWAKWMEEDKTMSKQLFLSPYKDCVYIHRDMFVNQTGRIVEIDIIVKDNMGEGRVKTLLVELLDQ